MERGELDRVALPGGQQGLKVRKEASASDAAAPVSYPARLLVRRKRSWYFLDAVVCTDAYEAPALDCDESGPPR